VKSNIALVDILGKDGEPDSNRHHFLFGGKSCFRYTIAIRDGF